MSSNLRASPVNMHICLAKPDPGQCLGYIPSYYWDPALRRCEQFVYGGCGGNSNNFSTKEACESTCKPRIDPRNEGNVVQATLNVGLLSLSACFCFKLSYY
ncbi:kunitz-type serine protease inhibitor-like [Gigantopelta aegis]|uniref:kunitz-type serine protease inhibitor-like n=1 Tax=Gigantopelta aegis TaxID=1735272 RepID=UPI001B88D7C0|nr:kunitz-type serine protease inhibitor-like [Gigantopelta aegis]